MIREQIVDVAVGHMLGRGVGRTNVDDVRAAAGVSGSQMSHYFPDKKSLVRAVIARQVRSVLAAHRQPELGGLDTFESLYRWAELFIGRVSQQGCRGGCALGSLAGELVAADMDIQTDLSNGFEQWLDLLRRGLAAMRERGDLVNEADPDELAVTLLSALQGGAMVAQVRRNTEPMRIALSMALARVRSFAADSTIKTSDIEVMSPP
jgi:AcrR family transcriptional regulator